MPALVEAFGQVFFFYVDLCADGVAVTVGDDVYLGGAERPFHGGSVVFGIVVIGVGLVEGVVDVQAADLGGHADDEVAAGDPFGREDHVVGAARVFDAGGVHAVKFELHPPDEIIPVAGFLWAPIDFGEGEGAGPGHVF